METDDENTTCIALSGHKTMTTDLKPNYDSEVCTSHVERKKSITVLIRKDEANNLQLDNVVRVLKICLFTSIEFLKICQGCKEGVS